MPRQRKQQHVETPRRPGASPERSQAAVADACGSPGTSAAERELRIGPAGTDSGPAQRGISRGPHHPADIFLQPLRGEQHATQGQPVRLVVLHLHARKLRGRSGSASDRRWSGARAARLVPTPLPRKCLCEGSPPASRLSRSIRRPRGYPAPGWKRERESAAATAALAGLWKPLCLPLHIISPRFA